MTCDGPFRVLGGLVLLTGIALYGCNSGKPSADLEPSDELKRILGADTIAVLTSANEVETYRIDHESYLPEKRKREGERINGFLVTRKGETQGSAFAAKLRTILLQDSAYNGDRAKCFDPGVAYRFKSGERTVEVAICFMCNNLDVRPNLKNQGEFLEIGGFSKSVRAQLLALTKEAFPDDSEIQAIAEK
jgi:hypothetical protein